MVRFSEEDLMLQSSSNSLAAAEQPLIIDDAKRGIFRVSRKAFVSPELFEQERREIFDRCWLYIAHESELPKPNDFVARSVGGRELIFNRDRSGAFAAFFNTCPHRGAQLVRERSGNAAGFKCFYHGWSFHNDGRWATKTLEAYPEGFNDDGCANLTRVPRLAGYCGFWFVNFDANACDLEDYLGGAKKYLEVIGAHSPSGMEIVGGVQEYSIRANWKLLVENSFDGYHAGETHSTYFEYLMNYIGEPPKEASKKIGAAIAHDLSNGHAVIEGVAPWGRPVAQWIPAWGEKGKEDLDQIYAELEQRLGTEKAMQIAFGNRNLLIFPNLVINDIMAITVRTFYPEAPDYMNVNSWALAPVGESPEFRKRRLDNFLEFLGPGGFATPDDVEALESAQKGYRNMDFAAWNDISRGMLKEVKAADDEEQMRCFWREWSRRVEQA